MEAQSRSYEEKPGTAGGDFAAGKEVLNLFALSMPSDSHPVVQRLER